MYEESFAKRLNQLRAEKGISARDMSLSLGQSESYINRIENQKMLPSMGMFFEICEFFKITPEDFFNFDDSPSIKRLDVIAKLDKLDDEKLEHIYALIEYMK